MGVELCLCLVWPSQTSSTAAAAASTAPAFYPLSSPQHTTSISRPCDPGPEPNALETDKQREGGESAETLLSIINWIFNLIKSNLQATDLYQTTYLNYLWSTLKEYRVFAESVRDDTRLDMDKPSLFCVSPLSTGLNSTITDNSRLLLILNSIVSFPQPTPNTKQIACLFSSLFNISHAKVIIRTFRTLHAPFVPYVFPAFLLPRP